MPLLGVLGKCGQRGPPPVRVAAILHVHTGGVGQYGQKAPPVVRTASIKNAATGSGVGGRERGLLLTRPSHTRGHPGSHPGIS